MVSCVNAQARLCWVSWLILPLGHWVLRWPGRSYLGKEGGRSQTCRDQHSEGEADTKQKLGVMALGVWVEAGLTSFQTGKPERLRKVKQLP